MFNKEKLNISDDETSAVSNEDMLTEPEAAQILKVSQMTLLRWRNSGSLAFYRLGGHRVMYSKSKHLLPFLKSCEKSVKNQSATEAVAA